MTPLHLLSPRALWGVGGGGRSFPHHRAPAPRSTLRCHCSLTSTGTPRTRSRPRPGPCVFRPLGMSAPPSQAQAKPWASALALFSAGSMLSLPAGAVPLLSDTSAIHPLVTSATSTLAHAIATSHLRPPRPQADSHNRQHRAPFSTEGQAPSCSAGLIAEPKPSP